LMDVIPMRGRKRGYMGYEDLRSLFRFKLGKQMEEEMQDLLWKYPKTSRRRYE